MNIMKRGKIATLLMELSEEEGTPILTLAGSLYVFAFMEVDVEEREECFKQLCGTINKIGTNTFESAEEMRTFVKENF